MHRFVKLIVLFICLPLLAEAQPGFLNIDASSKVPEHGLLLQAGIGIAAVNNDICKTPDCNRFGLNYSLGMFYKLNSYLAVSTELDYLKLGATEDNPSRPLNISFSSNIIEFSTSLVLNLKDSYDGTGDYRSHKKRFMVPFIKAGAGVVYYSPTSYTGNGRLNDAPEIKASERNYPAFAVIIPVGGGLRFRFSDKLSIAPELVYHISSTDLLDNIGPEKGNPDTDHYGVAAIKVLYTPSYTNRIFSKLR